ncbi:MAG: hypothetical protein PHY42_06635 [Bacilli bacterium]|nr:hypothetical protein [Bacilli bacterium]
MSTDYVKRYYGKVNTRIAQVNEKDPFSTSFISAIGAGDNTLFQKYMLETRVFDGTWVDFLEASIASIDTIVRNPKSFIKDQSEIVPIEMAKKTNAASVRHLASHSRYVKTITNTGEVIPEKILTVYREEDLAIYENRFVKTLIDKLVLFVEKRYATIVRLIGTDFINKFNETSKFEYDNIKVDFEMRLTIEKKVMDNEAEIRNKELLGRIEGVRAAILGFANSPFMRNLKSARPVQAPIQKTNILTRDPHYRKCYEVWLFLDSYGKIDYTVETGISEQKLNDDYLMRIRELILLSFATVVGNDESEMGRFATLPQENKRIKKTKVLSDPDIASQEKSVVMENHLINEYYYQEARRLYSRRINEAVADGEPYHVALKDVYQKAFQITESIFNSLMEIPDDVKKDPIALLRFRMRNQQALNQITKYKAKDLKKMEKAMISNEKQIVKTKAKLQNKKAIDQKPKVEVISDERLQAIKAKEREKQLSLKLKEKEREKTKLQKQKEKEREKARLLAQKQREKEKETLKRQKEKEREKARLLAQKEKEMLKGLSKEKREKMMARLEAKRLRELEKKKVQEATPLVEESTPMLKAVPKVKEEHKTAVTPPKPKRQDKSKEHKLLKAQKEKARLQSEKDKEKEKARLLAEKTKEKEKARLLVEKEKEKERARLLAEKEKEKEKARLLAEKAKEKEKARLLAEKEKEKEKARLLAEKEKEKARLQAQREKEKERERLKAQKEKEKAKLQAKKDKTKLSAKAKKEVASKMTTDQSGSE